MPDSRTSLPPLIILTGPTGIGKSELGLRLAQSLDTEIISADSLQVYKYFDIGSAKPPREYREAVLHHLMDWVEPEEEYNADCFRKDAEAIIRSLHERGKIPLVVGGTGLYIKTLTHSLDCAVRPDREIRARIREEMRVRGLAGMHAELERIDPVSATAINHGDRVRIERALEVYRKTGRTMTELRSGEGRSTVPRYRVALIVLHSSRENIYARIERRVDSMLKQGLVEEVRGLLQKGYSRDLKPFTGLGYQQALSFLDGDADYPTMAGSIKKETRHYAKRQLTWFRGMEGARWLDVGEGAEKTVKKIRGYLE